MKEKELPIFNGFSSETLNFLTMVREQNSKIWFEGHREDYNKYLLLPLQTLVEVLVPTIRNIDSQIELSPRIGKTISRIYRDTRFSKDKSLYRNDAWISFKRKMGENIIYPEFYLYITPISYEFGMGYYSASKKTMDNFRTRLETESNEFKKTIRFLEHERAKYVIIGERYKKDIKNNAPEDLQDWFKFKSFAVAKKKNIDSLFTSQNLAKEVKETFEKMGLLYKFLLDCSKNTLS